MDFNSETLKAKLGKRAGTQSRQQGARRSVNDRPQKRDKDTVDPDRSDDVRLGINCQPPDKRLPDGHKVNKILV